MRHCRIFGITDHHGSSDGTLFKMTIHKNLTNQEMQSVQIVHFVLVRIEILDPHNEDPSTMFVEALQHVVAPTDKNLIIDFYPFQEKSLKDLLTHLSRYSWSSPLDPNYRTILAKQHEQN